MISIQNLQRVSTASALKIILAFVKRSAGFANTPEEVRLRKVFSFLVENDCRLLKLGDGCFTASKRQEGLPELRFYIRENEFADESVFRHVVMQDAYRPLADLVRKVAPGMPLRFIMDCGANIGLASLYFAGQFPGSRILAVEPEPGNYALLASNIAINQLAGSIEPLQGGVWSESTQLRIMSDFRSGTSDSYYLSEKPAEGLYVQTYTIPELARSRKAGIIDILKLDIEGAEYQVFKGSNIQEILSMTRFIAIEIHDEFNSRDYIGSMLRAAGFVCSDAGELTIGYNQHFFSENAKVS